MTAEYKFRIYPDINGEWRWKLVAPNGKRIATSGEAFDSHSNAVRAARVVKREAGAARIVSSRRLRKAA